MLRKWIVMLKIRWWSIESEIDLDNLDSAERTDLFSDEHLDTQKILKIQLQN